MNDRKDGDGNADPFGLSRFVEAQETVYHSALAEIRDGRKRSHWMWFIFPQLDGLGSSPTARRFAIRSLKEARGYLGHPLLGSRLCECAQALLALRGRSAAEIFGFPDDHKLRSSMTLFALVAPPDAPYQRVLDRYFGGARDPRTIELLAGMNASAGS